ncbi:hypothetical protein OF829_14130 [Sphingomonas sp. LB-2]|uniref:hypothetical protein n=1 Tax=Sphingomonas caeni TaxID=2984949 RepID=UPI002232ABC6|nr:hypothetical protein [Sphingomonas caeni]MCW3848378.1 hypothetical protein [Sphingomonas caeni]
MPHQPGILASVMLSVMMLGAFGLVWGSWWMAFRRGNRLKGVLMLVCAVVIVGNVLIWTV